MVFGYRWIISVSQPTFHRVPWRWRNLRGSHAACGTRPMADGELPMSPEGMVRSRHKRRRHRSRGREDSGSHHSQRSQRSRDGSGGRHRQTSRRRHSRRRRRSRGRRRAGISEDGEDADGNREAPEPRHRDGGPPHIEVDFGTALGDEGRYIVEEVFGDGASGRVLGCREAETGKLVAVKVARPARRQRRHAETEVAMLRKLQRHNRDLAHRHVVRLLDTFEHEENFYCIVMEPLAMSLRGLLQEGDGGLYVADIRSTAHQLSNCLAFFQSIGLAHGDLKCTNVMLRRGDYELRAHPRMGDPDCMAARPAWPFEVVIIDFGLANVTEPDTSPEAFLFTRDNQGDQKKGRLRVGARHIRAPEVVLGLDLQGSAHDMWSLGCLLATLYTGERLFPVHDEMEHLAAIEQVTGLRIPPEMANGVAERILEKGVAFDESSRLLWPENAESQRQVEHVEQMPVLHERLGQGHSFDANDRWLVTGGAPVMAMLVLNPHPLF
eukprot:s332_g1.t1